MRAGSRPRQPSPPSRRLRPGNSRRVEPPTAGSRYQKPPLDLPPNTTPPIDTNGRHSDCPPDLSPPATHWDPRPLSRTAPPPQACLHAANLSRRPPPQHPQSSKNASSLVNTAPAVAAAARTGGGAPAQLPNLHRPPPRIHPHQDTNAVHPRAHRAR